MVWQRGGCRERGLCDAARDLFPENLQSVLTAEVERTAEGSSNSLAVVPYCRLKPSFDCRGECKLECFLVCHFKLTQAECHWL